MRYIPMNQGAEYLLKEDLDMSLLKDIAKKAGEKAGEELISGLIKEIIIPKLKSLVGVTCTHGTAISQTCVKCEQDSSATEPPKDGENKNGQ